MASKRLTEWVSVEVIEDVCDNSDCKVADFIDETSWYFPDSMDGSPMQTVEHLKEVDYDKSISDIVIWKPRSSSAYSMNDTYK